jgi:hypothetical protein
MESVVTHSLHWQPLTYSTMTEEKWTELNITFTGFIDLKPNYEDRVAVATSLGENEFWSSVNLYRHLLVLGNLFKVC